MATSTDYFCAICQSNVGPGEDAVRCPGCAAVYHAECWEGNGGCGVYGCPQVPETQKRGELEIPAAYWGRENKPCPNCGQEILAAAVRCRHCGTVFQSAAPETTGQFHQRVEVEGRLPGLRKGVVWLAVFCMVPCTAPAAGLIGLVWIAANRAEIRSLPGFHRALSKIAVLVGLGQTVVIALMVYLFSVVRHH